MKHFFGLSRMSRFAVVGLINTAFGYGVFAGLVLSLDSRVPYLGLLLVAHVVGVLEAFVLQRHFVFTDDGPWPSQLLRFWSVYLVALGANLLLLPALVEVGRMPVLPAQLLVLLALALMTFGAHSSFTFRAPVLAADAEPPTS